MGSPNNGPFNYVCGSIQLYTDYLDINAELSKQIYFKTFKSKTDFANNLSALPSPMRFEAQKFLKRTSSEYINFEYKEYENGLNVFKTTKLGNVPGSYAVYVKYVYKDGTIRSVYKDTVDNKGTNVHRHVKWPAKEI